MSVRLIRVATVLSTLLLLLLAGAVAWRRLPSFDGAMNLQVAKYLAETGTYGRHYRGLELFPSEVQTNGIPLFLGALSIKVAGLSELSLQMPNLIFLAVLAALFVWLGRPGSWLGAVAPLALLGVPLIVRFGLSGYGEVPTFVFQLGAILLLAHGLTGGREPARPSFQLLAFFLAGVAVVTKTVGVAVLPVLLGMVAVHRVALRQSNWRLDLVSIASLVAPIAAFELFRLMHLGSWDQYLGYWSFAAERIGYQSGLIEGTQDVGYRNQISVVPESPGLLASLDFRTATLGLTFGWGRTFALVFVGAPLALSVGCWKQVLQRMRRGDQPTNPLELYVLALGGLAIMYFTWWLFITPIEKVWNRRILIGILAVYGLYLLLLRLFTQKAGGGFRPAAVALLSFLLVTASVPWILRAVADAREPGEDLEAFEAAVQTIDSLPERAHVYGYGWWSAPQFGLYADRPIEDLSVLPTCSIEGQEAYLVWDIYASTLSVAEPPTRNDRLEYELVASFEGTADIYRVMPASGVCAGTTATIVGAAAPEGSNVESLRPVPLKTSILAVRASLTTTEAAPPGRPRLPAASQPPCPPDESIRQDRILSALSASQR